MKESDVNPAIFASIKDNPSDIIKLTFSGDIMCDMHEIPAYKTETGEYDFSDIFKDCKQYFSSSDYVVGNLETPIANADYSHEHIQFNSPVT